MAETSNQGIENTKLVKYTTQHLNNNKKKGIFLSIFNYFAGKFFH